MNFIEQVLWREVMQSVRRISVSKHYHKRSIKVSRAIHFQRICICISREFSAVTFQKENVQTEFLATVRTRNTNFALYFLSEDAEQGLLVRLHETAKYGFPERVLSLEEVF